MRSAGYIPEITGNFGDSSVSFSQWDEGECHVFAIGSPFIPAHGVAVADGIHTNIEESLVKLHIIEHPGAGVPFAPKSYFVGAFYFFLLPARLEP